MLGTSGEDEGPRLIDGNLWSHCRYAEWPGDQASVPISDRGEAGNVWGTEDSQCLVGLSPPSCVHLSYGRLEMDEAPYAQVRKFRFAMNSAMACPPNDVRFSRGDPAGRRRRSSRCVRFPYALLAPKGRNRAGGRRRGSLAIRPHSPNKSHIKYA